jgi:hypothetical protein
MLGLVGGTSDGIGRLVFVGVVDFECGFGGTDGTAFVTLDTRHFALGVRVRSHHQALLPLGVL